MTFWVNKGKFKGTRAHQNQTPLLWKVAWSSLSLPNLDATVWYDPKDTSSSSSSSSPSPEDDSSELKSSGKSSRKMLSRNDLSSSVRKKNCKFSQHLIARHQTYNLSPYRQSLPSGLESNNVSRSNHTSTGSRVPSGGGRECASTYGDFRG